MQEIGQVLKEARENAQISLDELSNQTMVAKKYLIALEEGNFKVFAGEVYLKGALRKYATHVGLDPQEILKQYNIGPRTQEEKVDTKEQPKENKQIGKPKEKIVKEPPVKIIVPRLRTNPKTIILSFVLIILALVGYWLLTNWNEFFTAPPSEIEGNDENEFEQQIPAPLEEEDDPQDLPEPDTIRVERDLEADGVVFNVYNADEISAELIFSDRCWIRATSDGQRLFEVIFSADQSETVEANQSMQIVVGFPPGMALKVNGIAVDLPDTESSYTMTIQLAQN